MFSHKDIEHFYFWKQNSAFHRYFKEENTNLIKS